MAETISRMAYIWLLVTDAFERALYLTIERLLNRGSAAVRSKPKS